MSKTVVMLNDKQHLFEIESCVIIKWFYGHLAWWIIYLYLLRTQDLFEWSWCKSKVDMKLR